MMLHRLSPPLLAAIAPRSAVVCAAAALLLAVLVSVLPIETAPMAWAADLPAPVARWDFESESTDRFRESGKVVRDQAGPRSPEFPNQPAGNQAILLEGRNAYLAVADPGENSPFDFTNGDAITLEAWVNPAAAGDGASMVVVAKGRTGNPGTHPNNQNWAMRLVNQRGEFKLNFLFASLNEDGRGNQWHRWTSHSGFEAETGWHLVTVSYQFGKPDSLRGWIDGKPVAGSWDMDGATARAPVVDNDEIWIGSSNVGTQFSGLLDGIAIYRHELPDAVVASRFERQGGSITSNAAPEAAPEVGEIAAGQVLFTLHGAMKQASRWFNRGEAVPEELARWQGEHFFLPRIPQRYDGWGIRDDWQAPALLRITADVELPPGEYKIWLRCRALSRLWWDDQVVLRTPPVTRVSRDGESPVTPPAQPPYPGLRPHGYHQQEIAGDLSIAADRTRGRLALELMVGAPGKRTETGEVLVAIQPVGEPMLYVLSPQQQGWLPLTDVAVEPIREQMEQRLVRLETDSRRRHAASQDEYWAQRHRFARQSAQVQQRPQPPATGDGSDRVSAAGGAAESGADAVLSQPLTPPSDHPVDRFVHAKINQAWIDSQNADAEQSARFHGQVLPILREHCFRCHGENANGGLRLDSAEAILRAGDSGYEAVVPGDLDASELIQQVRAGNMPPTEQPLSEQQIEILESWVLDGATWPAALRSRDQLQPTPLLSDTEFLRRAYLDTVGLPPTADEVRDFLADDHPDKRTAVIDRLLDDPRLADHWISFWQDLLAENPTLINQSVGSTGPFRWFLLDSLVDHKPLDRMVTELVMMRGSAATGGTAAFALAGETDSPMAAKGGILAATFLGIDLQCARCHDSPYHSTLQKDLYSLAAMLARSPVTVPETSRVPDEFFAQQQGRQSLIKVTLAPGEPIEPQWPFTELLGEPSADAWQRWLSDPNDSRQRLAYQITGPHNRRFAEVFVNRVWHRLIGAGIVQPLDDWEGKSPSHPQLLGWLSGELVDSGYDARAVIRAIMTSQLYQRQPAAGVLPSDPDDRFFSAPARRRLSAEQIVDSLHWTLGREFDCEELTFVHDGQRPLAHRQTLGVPTRSWMFASLNNERDRPSLALPRAAVIVDVLKAFGWQGSRQKPIGHREVESNVLQPGLMANGVLVRNLTRATFGSPMANLAIDADSPQQLVDEWFLRVLGRLPQDDERQRFGESLAVGFDQRIVLPQLPDSPPMLAELPQVTWFNHLVPETSSIQIEHERRVEAGPPVDPRLQPAWRELYEDFVWSLVNHPEFVWSP